MAPRSGPQRWIRLTDDDPRDSHASAKMKASARVGVDVNQRPNLYALADRVGVIAKAHDRLRGRRLGQGDGRDPQRQHGPASHRAAQGELSRVRKAPRRSVEGWFGQLLSLHGVAKRLG